MAQVKSDHDSQNGAKLWIAFAVLADCVGAYLAVSAGYFIVKYVHEQQDVARSQFATGAALVIGCSFGAFLLSALLLQPARRSLSGKSYVALLFPNLLMGLVFLLGCIVVLLDTFGLISI
jgi:threonine/homoserine efflux transporter RhtA